MPTVMMMLGVFRFSIDTAAYDEQFRTQDWEWAEQARVGGYPSLQFTGQSTELRQFKGIILPSFRGGLAQIELMRAQAQLALPLPLVTGTGFVLGFWVIVHIAHTETIFWPDGIPRKIEFNIQIKRYGSFLPI